MSKKLTILVFSLFATFVAMGVTSNILQQNAVDRSKLPIKIEQSKGFQRWITNLKNKNLDVGADDFRLQEEVELYNSKWTNVSSIEQPGKQEEFNAIIAEHQDIKKLVVFSPSKREFLDLRSIDRNGYKSNEVRFYGQKENKIIDTKILDCSLLANCYFDRGFFLNNDVFVVTEFSRNVHKKDPNPPLCAMNQECEYTIKLHVIDLINNSRLVYVSQPFTTVLETLIPQL
jgi:hypothetical protein